MVHINYFCVYEREREGERNRERESFIDYFEMNCTINLNNLFGE